MSYTNIIMSKVKSLDVLADSIIVKITNQMRLQQTTINIMNQNPSNYLLPFHYHTLNNEYHFYYDIKSKTSLSNFLNKNSSYDFFAIIYSMCSGIINSKEYYAKESSFFLDENFIFIDPINFNLFLMYLPIDINTNSSEVIKNLIFNLMKNVSFCKNEEFVVLDILKKIISTSNFSLSEIIKHLENRNSKKIKPIKKIIEDTVVEDIVVEDTVIYDTYITDISPKSENKSSIFIPKSNTSSIKIPNSTIIKIPNSNIIKTPESNIIKIFDKFISNKPKKIVLQKKEKETSKVKQVKSITPPRFAVYSGPTSEIKKENKDISFLKDAKTPDIEVLKKKASKCLNCFLLKENKDNIEKLELKEKSTTIGSSIDCDIILEYPKINCIHATITKQNNNLFFSNTSYKLETGFNGVFLNASKIEHIDKIKLKDYDRIKIYNFKFIIRLNLI